jgi:hypothetical protein
VTFSTMEMVTVEIHDGLVNPSYHRVGVIECRGLEERMGVFREVLIRVFS